jgi:hypothetical protein
MGIAGGTHRYEIMPLQGFQATRKSDFTENKMILIL